MKKQNVKVSILVPVYNVEEFLDRCVESLLDQTLEDIEIVLVDDGSTDGSGKICDKYAKSYPGKIKVIHQKNKGLCETRRTGMKNCSGDYIGFVDSDDFCDKTMFEKLYTTAIEEKADVAICSLVKCGYGMMQEVKGLNSNNVTPAEFLKTFSPGFMCNKLYKKELIPLMTTTHNGVQAEDIMINLPLMCKIKNLAYVNEPLYYYFQRKTASSNSDSFIKNYSIIDYLSTLEFILNSTESFDKKSKNNVYNYILQCLSWGFGNAKRKCYTADYIDFLQKIYPRYMGLSCLTKRMDFVKYLAVSTIPKTIYTFKSKTKSEIQDACNKSIEFYTSDYSHKEITFNKSDIDDSPECVKKANKNGNIDFVRDYFKVKTIYENGGIFIGENIKLNLPLGEMRAKPCFFGFKNNTELNVSIFGAVAGSEVMKSILESYEKDDFINEFFVPLERRIYFIFVGNYGISETGGWTQKLKIGDQEFGTVFRFDKLSTVVQSANVAQYYNELDALAEKENKIAIDKTMLEYWDTTRDKFSKEARESKGASASDVMKLKKQNKELLEKVSYLSSPATASETAKLRKQNKELQEKVDWLLGSTSWKITKPFRAISAFFKKLFKGRKKKWK